MTVNTVPFTYLTDHYSHGKTDDDAVPQSVFKRIGQPKVKIKL